MLYSGGFRLRERAACLRITCEFVAEARFKQGSPPRSEPIKDYHFHGGEDSWCVLGGRKQVGIGGTLSHFCMETAHNYDRAE